MKVTTKDVEYIAQLSRLTIPEGEMEKFTEQFNQILNYADILQKLDTAGIEPTPYVLPISNAFREDVALPGVTQEEALKNAPAVHNGGFKVPRVIELEREELLWIFTRALLMNCMINSLIKKSAPWN